MNKCCCFSVRTGSLIMGWLGLVGGILIALIYIVSYGGIDTVADLMRQALEQNHVAQEIVDQYVDAYKTYMPVIMISMIIMGIVNAVTCGLLLAGVYKEKPGLMMPYIVVAMISLVLSGINAILTPYIMGQDATGYVSSIIGGVIGIAIGSYLWYCVYSHYKNVKSEQEGGAGMQPMKA